MELMSGFYRQNEDSLSLLLQQYLCGEVPVCLGCICGGAMSEAGVKGGQITGWLFKEFRELSLYKAVEKPEKIFEKMKRKLDRYWTNCCVLQDFWTAGVLCIGNVFLLFYKGAVQVHLYNTYFGRSALQRIGGGCSESSELQFHIGSMEANIGILLASESFCMQFSGEELRNCLAVKDIKDPMQVQKRIRELGNSAEKKGGRNMAALLFEIR